MVDKVVITPADAMHFKGQFDKEISNNLTLKNPTKQKLTYKMKSTRSNRFKMRPVYGLIEPENESTVRISCRPFLAEREGVSKRDRFTVMIAVLPAGTSAPNAAWKLTDAAEIKEAKRYVVPVVYEVITAEGTKPTDKPTATAAPDKKEAEKPKEKEPEKVKEPEKKEAEKKGAEKEQEKKEVAKEPEKKKPEGAVKKDEEEKKDDESESDGDDDGSDNEEKK